MQCNFPILLNAHSVSFLISWESVTDTCIYSDSSLIYDTSFPHATSCPAPGSVETRVKATPMEKLSLVVLACIAALSCAPTCSASPENPQARHPHPIGARDWSNVTFPLTQAPLQDPSSIVPDVSPTSTCQTYAPCNLFYQVSHTALLPSI